MRDRLTQGDVDWPDVVAAVDADDRATFCLFLRAGKPIYVVINSNNNYCPPGDLLPLDGLRGLLLRVEERERGKEGEGEWKEMERNGREGTPFRKFLDAPRV